jgi:hypothetical protein
MPNPQCAGGFIETQLYYNRIDLPVLNCGFEQIVLPSLASLTDEEARVWGLESNENRLVRRSKF